MNVLRLALQAAQMKGWPCRQEATGEVRVEISPMPGRTQVVTVTMAQDGDGDAAAFIWSKAADVPAGLDPYGLLRTNALLTYGRIALRGNELIVLHALNDANAQLAEVGKTLFWVARAADELERTLFGGRVDIQ